MLELGQVSVAFTSHQALFSNTQLLIIMCKLIHYFSSEGAFIIIIS